MRFRWSRTAGPVVGKGSSLFLSSDYSLPFSNALGIWICKKIAKWMCVWGATYEPLIYPSLKVKTGHRRFIQSPSGGPGSWRSSVLCLGTRIVLNDLLPIAPRITPYVCMWESMNSAFNQCVAVMCHSIWTFVLLLFLQHYRFQFFILSLSPYIIIVLHFYYYYSLIIIYFILFIYLFHLILLLLSFLLFFISIFYFFIFLYILFENINPKYFYFIIFQHDKIGCWQISTNYLEMNEKKWSLGSIQQFDSTFTWYWCTQREQKRT